MNILKEIRTSSAAELSSMVRGEALKNIHDKGRVA
jgi:hypothetical protein